MQIEMRSIQREMMIFNGKGIISFFQTAETPKA